MKAFIVLFLSVLSFFISLIFLTKKEEKIEKNITSDYCTKGKLKTCLKKIHLQFTTRNISIKLIRKSI